MNYLSWKSGRHQTRSQCSKFKITEIPKKCYLISAKSGGKFCCVGAQPISFVNRRKVLPSVTINHKYKLAKHEEGKPRSFLKFEPVKFHTWCNCKIDLFDIYVYIYITNLILDPSKTRYLMWSAFVKFIAPCMNTDVK